jgi:hypothetical protein
VFVDSGFYIFTYCIPLIVDSERIPGGQRQSVRPPKGPGPLPPSLPAASTPVRVSTRIANQPLLPLPPRPMFNGEHSVDPCPRTFSEGSPLLPGLVTAGNQLPTPAAREQAWMSAHWAPQRTSEAPQRHTDVRQRRKCDCLLYLNIL